MAQAGSWGRKGDIWVSISWWLFFTCSSKLAKSESTFPQKSLDLAIMSVRILSNSSQVDEKKGSLKKGSRILMGTISRDMFAKLLGVPFHEKKIELFLNSNFEVFSSLCIDHNKCFEMFCCC